MTTITGLSYQSNFMTESEEQELITAIDAQIWLSVLQRRVQHYGYLYDYRKRTVDAEMYLGKLPDFLQPLIARLLEQGILQNVPDQAIINEYQTGQGIAPHVDCEPCFGATIISLSLGASCIMDFYHRHSDTVYSQVLEARSLLVLNREARYEWKHGIAARKSDMIQGMKQERQRRISITLRSVLLA